MGDGGNTVSTIIFRVNMKVNQLTIHLASGRWEA